MLLPDLAPAKRPLAVIPVGAAEERPAELLVAELRRAGFAVDLGFGGNMGKRMKRANKIAAVAALILGEEEVRGGTVAVRNLDSGEQTSVSRGELTKHLAQYV
jgi:histidyl-tRNA synthetase